VPQNVSNEAAQYNPAYLADFAKARVELGAEPTKKGGASPVVRYNGGSPAIVDFAYGTSFQAIGVIMPIRDRTDVTYYLWASTPAREWPAA